ncbi:MAG: TPM domain-containing protein [Novosphingobium sp.]|uniref:TPM domain-containing protein n=1 Tax=Novosphingobium sp. TaxID=1874826 RepID=UPI0032B99A76
MGPRPLTRPDHAFARIAGALLWLAALLAPGWAAAQTFPPLTGPVVDAANVIPADVEARMTQKLLAFNQQSGRQLQVATVTDLQGYEISDYGYQLGRAWGIGDKERNDGALLLIAPSERKVRIEVGYGLEATLTDALSSQIIRKEIVPRFKAGDMPGGIEAGTDALIKQLQLPPDQARQAAAQAAKASKSSGIDPGFIIWLIIFVLFFVLPMIRRVAGGRRYNSSGLGPIIMWNVLDGISRGGGSSGGSSWGGGGGGGGWSGGGGSFGGGGSSGGW